GFTYRPTTSRSFDSKLGSVESLEVSTFHSRIRRACHIRATVSLPIPYRAAIDLVDQHAEPSSGTVCNVSCTIASTTSSPSTTGRPRPARMSPTAAVPSAANRLRHRRTDFGVDAHRRAISAFETPSVAHNNALAWRTSRAGAVCERASRSSSARCPPVISKAPAAATIPPTLQQITIYATHRRCSPSAVLLRNAIPSVLHQRHIGRVLRSSCNPRGRRLASSRGREPQPGRCPSLWPGDLRNDGISVAAAGADGSET